MMTPRASKRKRAEIKGQSDIAGDKHTAFTSWCEAQSIVVKHVRPAEISGRGIGLLTTQAVKAGTELIKVPASAMIRPLSKLDADLSPQAELTITLMHLKHQENSRYLTCASVWPSEEEFNTSLPWYGRTVSQDWIDIMPQALSRQLKRLQKDYDQDRQGINSSLESLSGDIADFEYHWALSNTRSFSWKPEGSKKGSMVMCPFLDYVNHCPFGGGCDVTMNDSGYRLVANRDYKMGEEIFATYGAHTNDKLLAHYGFIMPDSSDDSIVLDEIILPHLSSQQQDDLLSVGYLGNWNLEPNTNEICFRTQVALRAKLLTSNEWEYFMISADDIADDKAEEVRVALRGMIDSFQETIEHNRDRTKDLRSAATHEADKAVLDAIRERWNQISKGLSAFSSVRE